MELVLLRCNRDPTSPLSYWLGWYKSAIATRRYQFHTTDAWRYFLGVSWITCKQLSTKTLFVNINGFNIENLTCMIGIYHIHNCALLSNIHYLFCTMSSMVWYLSICLRLPFSRVIYSKISMNNTMRRLTHWRLWWRPQNWLFWNCWKRGAAWYKLRYAHLKSPINAQETPIA